MGKGSSASIVNCLFAAMILFIVDLNVFHLFELGTLPLNLIICENVCVYFVV